MKNSVKKILALTLAAASLLSVASCGKKKDPANGEVKTATMWISAGGDKAFWEEQIERFNTTVGKEIGVQVEADLKIDAAYTQQLDIAIETNQLPDFFTNGSVVKLVELDRVVALEDVGLGKFIEPYRDNLRERSHMLDGKTYMIPTGVALRGLIYNKDMFKAAGIVDENGEAKPPKTFAEVREYAKKLTDKSKNQFGIALPIKWVSWVESDIENLLQSSYGRGAYDPVTKQYDYTIMKPILEAYIGMREDGSIYPSPESLDNDPARARFAEGFIGMKMAYSFDVGVLNDQFPAKCDWGVAPLPVVNENEVYRQYSQGGSSAYISKSGVEKLGKDAVKAIFEFFYGDDVLRERYERGISIPMKASIMDDAVLDADVNKGWEDFCALSSISLAAPLSMPVDIEGKMTVREGIVNKIWANPSSIDAVLEELTKNANEGIIKYQEKNPERDYSIYEDKNWNKKVKLD